MHKNTTNMFFSCQYIYLIHRNAFTGVYIITVRDTCAKKYMS